MLHLLGWIAGVFLVVRGLELLAAHDRTPSRYGRLAAIAAFIGAVIVVLGPYLLDDAAGPGM